MNTRAVATNFKLQQWAEVIQRHKESGQNTRSYCEDTGIKEHVYYYWQRKLREAACKGLSKIQSSVPIPEEKTSNNKPITWAEVNMKELSISDAPTVNNIKIIRDGWTITVEAGFDSGTLVEALRAVNRVC